jgi:hypothetical protein
MSFGTPMTPLKIPCPPPNASPRLLYHPTHMMHTNVNIKKLTFNKLLQTFMTLTYNQYKKHMINIKTFIITFVTT